MSLVSSLPFDFHLLFLCWLIKNSRFMATCVCVCVCVCVWFFFGFNRLKSIPLCRFYDIDVSFCFSLSLSLSLSTSSFPIIIGNDMATTDEANVQKIHFDWSVFGSHSELDWSPFQQVLRDLPWVCGQRVEKRK